MRLIDKSIGSLLAVIGFVLSPLSWWNDLYVNLPISYALAWPVSLINERLFSFALIFFYWCSNVVGLALLHKGSLSVISPKIVSSLSRNQKILMDLAVSAAYTVIIIILVALDILKPPQEYFD